MKTAVVQKEEMNLKDKVQKEKLKTTLKDEATGANVPAIIFYFLQKKQKSYNNAQDSELLEYHLATGL